MTYYSLKTLFKGQAVVKDTLGVINYLDNDVSPSLVRNGKVRTNRDKMGNDIFTIGLSPQHVTVPISNARILRGIDRPSLHTKGFELIDCPIEDSKIEFKDSDSIINNYYKSCEELVSGFTQGIVFAFDHNVRSIYTNNRPSSEKDAQMIQKPIHFVHGDYTLLSAPKRLRDLSCAPHVNDTFVLQSLLTNTAFNTKNIETIINDGRFCIVNVWRNIAHTPIKIHPLALCDSHTVYPQDLVVHEIHYEDRIGENYFSLYSPEHKWYYYPEMNRDEALLIKQWDSSGPFAVSEGALSDSSDIQKPSTFCFHCAFDYKVEPAHVTPRWSIEVRCIVVYT